MQPRYTVDKVTVLMADRDQNLCRSFQICGQAQPMLEVCAVADSAERVLELIGGGLRPQVLVLDALLTGCGIFGLLRRLPQAAPGYAPHILVTSVPLPQNSARHLMTLGAEYIILKPYLMSDLFDTVIHYGCDEQTYQTYRVRSGLYTALGRLNIGAHPCGARYLEKMLCCLVLDDRPRSTGELYDLVAEAENLSRQAVISGVRRLVEIACARDTELYRQLCTLSGKPAGTRLTNAAFLHSLAEYIRQTMWR